MLILNGRTNFHTMNRNAGSTCLKYNDESVFDYVIGGVGGMQWATISINVVYSYRGGVGGMQWATISISVIYSYRGGGGGMQWATISINVIYSYRGGVGGMQWATLSIMEVYSYRGGLMGCSGPLYCHARAVVRA